MKGSEALNILGNSMYENFSIETEPHLSCYRKVYENFVSATNSDKQKGILIIGKVGVGKTAMMKIFQRLFKDTKTKFKWVCANEFKYLLDEYTNNEIMSMYGRGCDVDLYIDDIGMSSSDDFKRYGNSINIINEIIYERYELFLDKGIRTHFSTNLPTTVDKIKYPEVTSLVDVYGERIIDRLKQMCETIIIKGESLRK